MEHTNVIELNGKRYDAVTGKYLGKSHAQPVPAAKSSAGRAMDGIVRSGARPNRPHLEPAQTKEQPKSRPARDHHKPSHLNGHQPQQTKTLMRQAVTKPKPLPKKEKTAKGLDRAPIHTLALKESVTKVNPYRQQRANLARRHQDIKRFEAVAARASSSAVTARSSRPVESPRPSATQTAAAPVQQSYNSMFEAAIAHATSHQEPKPRVAKKHSRSRRALHATLAVIIVLGLGGFAAWTQRGQIELQIASWQAGFDARMPSYALTDYKRSAIHQEQGGIVVNYQSGDSHYRISQQPSSWNSQTLLDQDVAGATTEDVETIESKGRIIYIYDNNASWVDGGVRYDITGNAPLTTEDILSIVDSM